MLAYTDSVNGPWGLAYDGLNRLAGASVTPAITDGDQYFCWNYDSFGNRLNQLGSNEPFRSGLGTCQPAANANITGSPMTYNAQNQVSGPLAPTYDAAGDVILTDGAAYLYDPEGHVCAVKTIPYSGGLVMIQYLYDASGERVAKGSITSWSCDPTTNGFAMTNQYIRGPGGEQMTELTMASGTTTPVWEHTNVYAAGSLIATYENDSSGPHFRFSDWLGTMRAQTNYAGVPEQTCTSLPFGDGPPCASNLATEQFFTGKERDAESGLDDFGPRYYTSSMGRFMSPDPLYIAAHRLINPQSLNLYSYVGNNPLSLTDSTGLDVKLDCQDKQQCSDTVSELNSRKGSQFTVTQNAKTGLLQVDGKVDTSKLSSSEAGLYNAITNTDIHATLSVVGESADVQFGRFDGNGHNTLDHSDLALLNAASPSAAGEVVAHEALEAFGSAGDGHPMDYGLAHGYADQFFGRADNPTNENFLFGAKVTTYQQVWDFGRINQSFLVNKVVTPIPSGSFNVPGYLPGKITGVEKIP